MKRAYLIVGPESAGNRLLAAILSLAGCHGEGSLDAPFNEVLPIHQDPVAVIRSMPHGGIWPDLVQTVMEMQSHSYDVHALVTVRDHTALTHSQVYRKHQPDLSAAIASVREAYLRTFKALDITGVPFSLVPYEAVVQYPITAVPELLESIGLPRIAPQQVEIDGRLRFIADENEKHYEGVPA